MEVLARRPRSARRLSRLAPAVMALEDRNLMAVATVGLPPTNLSAATITAWGQNLANFVKQIDPAHALQDLTQLKASITNQANQLLAHPVHNAAAQQFILQLDANELAVIGQAITDLTPPASGGGGGVIA